MTEKTGRPKRTSQDLQKASFHVHYEVQMLRATAELLQSKKFDTPVVHNALLESFAVHTRGLLYFLYGATPREDDIVAQDFLDNPSSWASARPEITSLLSKVTKRVGKEVAHLTYVRQVLPLEEKGWNFTQIADDILNVIDKFLVLAPPSVLCDEWKNYKHTPFRFTAVTDTAGP